MGPVCAGCGGLIWSGPGSRYIEIFKSSLQELRNANQMRGMRGGMGVGGMSSGGMGMGRPGPYDRMMDRFGSGGGGGGSGGGMGSGGMGMGGGGGGGGSGGYGRGRGRGNIKGEEGGIIQEHISHTNYWALNQSLVIFFFFFFFFQILFMTITCLYILWQVSWHMNLY